MPRKSKYFAATAGCSFLQLVYDHQLTASHKQETSAAAHVDIGLN
jgi:hypothetical protein